MKTQWIALSLTAIVLLGGCTPKATTSVSNDTTTTTTTTTDRSTTINATTTDTTIHQNTSVTMTHSTSASSSIPHLNSTTAMPTANPSVDTTTAPHSSTSRNPSSSVSPTVSTSATTSASQPQHVSFIATVRGKNQQPISGITVTVYAGTAIGHGVTDKFGVAQIPLTPGDTYRVVLTGVPTGYVADTEYHFVSTRVNINLRRAAPQNEADHSDAAYETGMMMGNFTLTDIEGNTYRLSELQATKKLIILDFWYIGCTFCVKEFPSFEATMKKYKDDVILLAVNPFDHSDDTIRSFRNQFKKDTGIELTFPLLRDSCQLTQGFEVTSFPTTVFITADGVIRDIHTGYYSTTEAFQKDVLKYIS